MRISSQLSAKNPVWRMPEALLIIKSASYADAKNRSAGADLRACVAFMYAVQSLGWGMLMKNRQKLFKVLLLEDTTQSCRFRTRYPTPQATDNSLSRMLGIG